eukprot:6202280-Pleurochrysis_carterae.AAC.3
MDGTPSRDNLARSTSFRKAMGMTPRQSPQAGSATSSSKLTPKGPRWWHFGRHRSTGSLSGSSDGRANRGGAQTLHAADSDAQLGDEVEISRPAFSFKKGKVKGRSRSVPSIASDEPPRPPPLETESSWHEVDRAEMPRENDDSPTKLRQTAMFIGSKGYCLLHPDGSRSYATCRQARHFQSARLSCPCVGLAPPRLSFLHIGVAMFCPLPPRSRRRPRPRILVPLLSLGCAIVSRCTSVLPTLFFSCVPPQ